MLGLLQWDAGSRIRFDTELVLGMRCLCARVPRGEKTPEVLLRRRCRKALRKMAAQGADAVILPEGSGMEPLLERCGVHAVSTLPLRWRLAADWAAGVLKEEGKAGTIVAVTAERLTGAVVRTITELALRHRYLLLEIGYGGEELCRSLRREYGVSPQLNPGRETMETAEVWVAFDPVSGEVPSACRLLPVYDEHVPLPPLLLPPVLEEQLPGGVCREQLLAALLAAGRLAGGQISLGKAEKS